jgi:hypothetical protein
MVTKYWLGVVQRSHVQRGVALGIAQMNHGARGGLDRMHPGDGLVFYSPKTEYPDGAPLREFTAIGTVADDAPWQAIDGDFRPWRRRVDFDLSARAAPIVPLLDALEFTRGNRNWGLALRRGQIELSAHDFEVIAQQMGSGAVTGSVL